MDKLFFYGVVPFIGIVQLCRISTVCKAVQSPLQRFHPGGKILIGPQASLFVRAVVGKAISSVSKCMSEQFLKRLASPFMERS